MFSVRIVSTDHYLSSPIPNLDVQYADLRGSEVKKVPVVRIFGATPAGQKTCMHVHGVFPYLYVPYDGTVPWDRYLRQFAISLDKAINVAQGHGHSNIQHVYKIVLVSGTCMYGYHDKEQQFLKIYMYNPQMVRKAADLLLGGAVLNKPFQPHESHIPYTLQLFIDYNLYGMNMINVAAVKFRRKVQNDNDDLDPGGIGRHGSQGSSQGSEGYGSDPHTPGASFTSLFNRSGSVTGSATPSRRLWDHENIPSELYLDGDVERLSTCELEVDVVAADILNRLEVTANVGANPGLAALWEDEKQRRQDRGESTDIAPPKSPERIEIEVADSETLLRERYQQIIQDLQPYMDSQSDSESDMSQTDDIQLTQASTIDLHLSQDDDGGSQDTVMLDLDDEAEAVINLDSIQHVVSHSQSFSALKPKLSSQDKSLVDILAALAEDTTPPASQHSPSQPASPSQHTAVDIAVALEDHDSVLSQTSQPRDTEMEQQEEAETLEMSQVVIQDDRADVEDEYDVAGMNDTWIDSQLDTAAAADDTGNSDSDCSDVIPQYDGPMDERTKEEVKKRLGMRGPMFNMSPRAAGQGQMESYGNQGNMNPGFPSNYGDGTGQMAQFSPPAVQTDWGLGGQKQNWNSGAAGAAMFPGHQFSNSQKSPSHSQQRSPGHMQRSPGSMQQSPSNLQMSHSNLPQQSSSHMGQSHSHLQMSPGHNQGPPSLNQLPPDNVDHFLGNSGQSHDLLPTMTSAVHQSPPDHMPPHPQHLPVSHMQHSQAQSMHIMRGGMHQSQRGRRSSAGMSPGSYHQSPPGQDPLYGSHGNQQPSQFPMSGNHSNPHMYSSYVETKFDNIHPGQGIPGRFPMETRPPRGISMNQHRPGFRGQIDYRPRGQRPTAFHEEALKQHLGRGGRVAPYGMSQYPRQPNPLSGKSLHRSPVMEQPPFYPGSKDMMIPPDSGGGYVIKHPSKQRPQHQDNSLQFGPTITDDGFGGLLGKEPEVPMSANTFDDLTGDKMMTATRISQPNTMAGPPSSMLKTSTAQPSQGYVVKRPGGAGRGAGQIRNSPPQIGTFIGGLDNFASSTVSKDSVAKSHQKQQKQQQQQLQDMYPHGHPSSNPNMESPRSGYNSQGMYHIQEPKPPSQSPLHTPQNTSLLSLPSESSSQTTTKSHSSMFPLNERAGNFLDHLPLEKDDTRQLEMFSKTPLALPKQKPMDKPLSVITSESKTSPKNPDQLMGPIARYYAKKKMLLYEQISPPATPTTPQGGVDKEPNKATKLQHVSLSPSSSLSEPQMSPLEKLLQEPCSPSLKDSSHNRSSTGQMAGSLSRTSMASPASSDKMRDKQQKGSPMNYLQGRASAESFNKSNQSLDSPGKLVTETNVESKLYSLLAAGNKSNTSQKDANSSYDSQQDLFAESLLSTPKARTNSNSSQLSRGNDLSHSQFSKMDSSAGDSLASLFDDNSFDNQPTDTQSVPLANLQPSLNIRSTVRGAEKMPEGPECLSTLENFVGSVEKGPEYGVTFKPDAINKELSLQQQQHQTSFLSQLNDLDSFDNLDSQLYQQQQQHHQQQQSIHHQQQQSDYNITNWPEYQTTTKMGKSNHIPGTAPKKRGRPSLKKTNSAQSGVSVSTASLSNPGIPTGLPVGKRKRGRPRKNSIAQYPSQPQLPPVQQQQQQQQYQQHHQQGQQKQYHSASMYPNNLPMQQQPHQQQSQQQQQFQSLQQQQQNHQQQFMPNQQGFQDITSRVLDSSLHDTRHIGQGPGLGTDRGFPHMGQGMDNRSQDVGQGIGQNQSPLMPQRQESMLDELTSFDIPNQGLPVEAGFQQQLNNVNEHFQSNMSSSYQQQSPFIHQQHKQQSLQKHQPDKFQQNQPAMSHNEPFQQSNPVAGPSHQLQQENFFNSGSNPSLQNTMSTIDVSQLMQEAAETTQEEKSSMFNLQNEKQYTTNLIQSENQIMSGLGSNVEEGGESQAAENRPQKSDFHMTTLQSMTEKYTLVQGAMKTPPVDSSSIDKLIHYRVRPQPKPSPDYDYNYKFVLPTPVFKRLKFHARHQDSKPSDQVEYVRMHPKDARKYSLLKIGREVVSLKKLTIEKIRQLQEDFKAGINVEAIPPALRVVEIAKIVPKTSIIADLLSCDSPDPGDMDTEQSSAPTDKLPSSVDKQYDFQSSQMHQKESLSDSNLTIPVKSDLSNEIEGHIEPHADFLGNHTDEPVNNDSYMKRQRKNSEGREKKVKGMFKSKNISNIPHLKKYRAGFSYFGKGNVGRGGSVKVRQNHPVLGPDYEDNGEIILRDVSLDEAFDGVLTPIKSRTPVAGRSPAHYSGNMSELDPQEKDHLETKLKSMEYELDLDQSNNSQMFQEALFVEKEVDRSDAEISNDENELTDECDYTEDDIKDVIYDSDDHHSNNSENFDSMNSVIKVNLDGTVDAEKCVLDKNTRKSNKMDIEDENFVDEDTMIDGITEGIVNDVTVDKEKESNDDASNNGYNSDVHDGETKIHSVDSLNNNDDKTLPLKNTEKRSKSLQERLKENDDELNKFIETNKNSKTDLRKSNKDKITGSEKDTITYAVDNLIENIHTNNASVFFGKFKKHFEEKNAKSIAKKSAEHIDIKKVLPERLSRSRSSSCESRSVSSRSGSRRSSVTKTLDNSSVTKTLENTYLSKALSNLSNTKRQAGSDSSDNKSDSKKHKKSETGSRKNSRSSSIENDYKRSRSKAKRFRRKRKPNESDSDSDGIPGVDFIVTGRFKGHREMKVVLNKVNFDNKVGCIDVNDFDSTKCDKKGCRNETYRKPLIKPRPKSKKQQLEKSKNVTGFTAEFEKFLLASQSKEDKLLDATIDKPEEESPLFLDNCKMDGSEIVDLETRTLKVSDSDSKDSKDSIITTVTDFSKESEDELKANEVDFSIKSENRLALKENEKTEPTDTIDGGNELNPHDIEDGKEIDNNSDVNDASEDSGKGYENRDDDNEGNHNASHVDKDVDNDLYPGNDNEVHNSGDDNVGEVSEELMFHPGNRRPDGTILDLLSTATGENTGLKDFTSSSDDESKDKQPTKRRKTLNTTPKKKRRGITQDRLGQAFCTKRRKRPKRTKSKPTKLMCTLSVLHEATMEKLTISQGLTGSSDIDSASNQSPMKIRDLSDIDSPVKSSPVIVERNFEMYTDKTEDHLIPFSDTMYHLSYYSPPLSDQLCDSPPQPLSPEEIKEKTEKTNSETDKTNEHKEQKLTLSDIIKNNKQSKAPMLGEQFYETPASSVETLKSKENSPKSGFDLDILNPANVLVKGDTSPVKTAVAKVATLTLKDIKSYCEEENAMKKNSETPKKQLNNELASPPDLGPPIIHRFNNSPRQSNREGSPPPALTPSKTFQQHGTKSDKGKDSKDSADISDPPHDLPNAHHTMDDKTRAQPPFLTPCQSPRVPNSPHNLSPSSKVSTPGHDEGKGYFSLPRETEGKSKPGRSPGASSAGSINVIHSEQFSDISDESGDDSDYGPSLKLSKSFRDNSPQPTWPVPPRRYSDQGLKDSSSYKKADFKNESQRRLSYEHAKPQKSSPKCLDASHDKEKKLREIKEFENRLKLQDDGFKEKNTLYKLLSMKHTSNTDSNQQKSPVFTDSHTQGKLINPDNEKHEHFTKTTINNNNSESEGTVTKSSKQNEGLMKYRKEIEALIGTMGLKSPQSDLTGICNNNNNPTINHMNTNGRVSSNEQNVKTQDSYTDRTNNHHISQNDTSSPRNFKRSFSSSGTELTSPMKQNSQLVNSPYQNVHENQSFIKSVNSTHQSQRNFFENFSLSYDKSIRDFDRGINSGDLFDSYSSHQSTQSAKIPPPFNRSLSESAFKSDYSIVRNNRLNDSIIRSVNARDKMNCSNRPQHFSLPMTEYGSGNGKTKPNFNKSSQGHSPRSNYPSQGQSGSRGQGSGGRHGGNFDLDNSQRGHRHGNTGSQGDGYHVITPRRPPPLHGDIHQSANQYGLPSCQMTGAFYGNHSDVPDKPSSPESRRLTREGVRLMKLPTLLVRDLEEFNTSSLSLPSSSLPPTTTITGLTNWRTTLSRDTPSPSSQNVVSNLLEKLDKEPSLRYAITGDQSTIISPTLLPPTRREIEKWCQGRQMYRELKTKAGQKGDKDNRAFQEGKRENKPIQKEEEFKTETEKKTSTTEKDTVLQRLNLFTGLREPIPDDSKTGMTKSEILLKETDTTNINIGESQTAQNQSKSIVSVGAESGDSPITSSQKDQNEPNVLHSTPMGRRASTELFEPQCTPIAGDEKSMDQEKDDCQPFVTPKRIRPLRRISTNTETTLRRAIISSQMKHQFGSPAPHQRDVSQIDGPTPKNSFGFKVSQQNFQDAKALHEFQYLTILSVEIHAETRGDLRPDPEYDPIQAIFYSIFNDVPADQGTRHVTGVIIIDPQSANLNSENKPQTNQQQGDKSTNNRQDNKAGPSTSKHVPSEIKTNSKETLLQKSGALGLTVDYVKDELELLQNFKELILKWDPDILVGYEIQMLSWGYVLQRASTLSVNLTMEISRVPTSKQASHHKAEKDEFGADYNSEIHIAGRIVLNLWRLLKAEVTLNVYSFENVAFHVLHRRIPLYSFKNLTTWHKHRTHLHRWKVLSHYTTRVKGCLEIMEQLDLVGRTSEFARVFGIEFYHVLSRGSQYRVESMMLRVAKPMNRIPVSPSVHQRARMKAPECIPLTLEPQSRFYTDPVVVLDFQSLYPSIMIAYNYCFSTCLGRMEWFQKAHEGPIEFGCTSLNLNPNIIQNIEKDATISPNGVVFCKQSVKRGVLPVMVEEILNTRLMVKKAMSSYKDDKTLSRMLHARQLGLKLIANVTYGYTGANFSGRMPCIEIGDSIVRKARETLERSIKLVEDTPRWGAQLVYGDTDSMFLLFKGKSKDEAFTIGQEIANAVTAMFPKPIKLKFEKVYLPCVLQTKKRYVGFMYETRDQKEPKYDAKGIETVRRDSCPAVSKMLERSIKILFTSHDVSQVKAYIQQQCQKIMEGTVSLQDFIFAKEYRGMPGYKPGACVPALEIAKKVVRQDRRSEPRVGERVPYVIVYGSPGLPLIQLVRQPGEMLQDQSLRLNATYYITKQILPPMARFMSLLGVDVFLWYREIPHTSVRALTLHAGPDVGKKGTISQYFVTSNCPLCDKQTKLPVCRDCMKEPQHVCVTLNDRIMHWERVSHHLQQICGTCTGCSEPSTVKACVSLDCPILYRVARANRDLQKVQVYRDLISNIFK